jgi:CHAT domain-containing protein/Tfp pilus assembly protein PilF
VQPPASDKNNHGRARVWRGAVLAACVAGAVLTWLPQRPADPPPPPVSQRPAAPDPAMATLHPGVPLEVDLQPVADRDHYVEIAVAAAPPLRLRVVERGIDIHAELLSGATRWLFEDDDVLRWGEHRVALAGAAPDLRLRLRAPRVGSPAGTVRLELQAVDPGSAGRSLALDLEETALVQRLNDRKLMREPETAARAAALCAARRAAADERGYVHCVGLQERILARQPDRPAAIAALTDAMPAWRRLGDPRGLASALNNLGMHHYRMGDPTRALPALREALAALDGVEDTLLRAVIANNICLSDALLDSGPAMRACYEDALALSQASGDGQRVATALNNLGGAYWQLGETARAAGYFEDAVQRWQSFHDNRGSAEPLNNLALVQFGRGRLTQALDGFERAGKAYAGDLQGQARTLRNQGAVRLLLGDAAYAVDLLKSALELTEKLNRPDEIVTTLARLAEAQLANGQPAEARASVERAMAVALAATTTTRSQLIVDSQLRAARVYRRSGEPAAALNAAQQAFDSSADTDRGDLHDLARIELAHLALQRGDAAQAQRSAEAALKSARLTQLQHIEAQTLVAGALRAQGHDSAAEAAYRKVIAAVDEAGSYVFDLEQRATFLAGQRDAQVGLLSLLMSDVDAQGGHRRAADALSLSARFRARSLRSRLDAMPLPVATDAAGESEREQLLARLAALALLRWKQQNETSIVRQPTLPTAAGDARRTQPEDGSIDEGRRRIDADIRSAEAALRSLDSTASLPDPAAAADELSLAQLQQALPADTTLVVYRTLPQAGYAWVVQPDALHSVRLAAQDDLAAAVQRVRDSLGATPDGAAGDWREELTRACELVWRPIAGWVDTQRVLVVSDTALDGLPFAALRCGETPSYLLERHELALLPATWLLRRAPVPALEQDFAALLIGDPVYSRDDPRLGATPPAIQPGLALRNSPRRLRGSGDEIRRVSDRLGAAHSTLLAGLDANLAALRRDDIANFDIMHFATHGTGDRSGASGSGLVLSLFDAQGRDIDGFLSARRIGASRLPAALVVLGACDTATGRTVQDEGTFGVAYAFLQAGARHVVATLWPVDDAAMPELMDGFYADPRLAAQRPAQALREAQLALLRQYPESSPALWSGVAVWGW